MRNSSLRAITAWFATFTLVAISVAQVPPPPGPAPPPAAPPPAAPPTAAPAATPPAAATAPANPTPAPGAAPVDPLANANPDVAPAETTTTATATSPAEGNPATAATGDAAPPAEKTSLQSKNVRVSEEVFDPGTEARLWRLRDHTSLRGSTGIFRTHYAGSGPVGTFRFALLSSFFSGSGFLCPQCEDPDGGPGDVDDDVSRVGAHVRLSVTPLEFLEAYLGIHSTATSNTRGDPELLQVLGDTTWGVKGFMPYEEDQIFTAGGAMELWFLNGTGGVGIDGVSVALRGLATVDLSNQSDENQRLPIRFNANLSYVFDNSGNLVEDIEDERQRRITRIERYGLNVNRIDRFIPAIGVEGMWEVVRPYMEWSIDIPSNRQGYSCLRNDVHASDSCLNDDARLGAVPSRLTIGARGYPFMPNLAFHAAFDFGTGGTNALFWEEVQPETPWNFHFGVAYAVDVEPQVKVRTLEPLPPEPLPPPAQYFIEGSVVEAGTEGTPVPGALVRYEGRDLTGMIASDAGVFRTAPLEPGAYTFGIEAEDYEPGQCTVTIEPAATQPQTTPAPGAQQPVGEQPGVLAGAAAPAPAGQPAPSGPVPPGGATTTQPAVGAAADPTGTATNSAAASTQSADGPPKAPQFVTRVRCELKAKPRVGNVDGFLFDGNANQPLAGGTVTITDSLGRSLTLEADDQGAFRFENVPPGQVSIAVQAVGFMSSTQRVDIIPREDVRAEIFVFRKPARANVIATAKELRLRKPILFDEGTAQLTTESQGLIDEIAALLRTRTELGPIEIQGHTDNSGAADFNLQLSQERASAVRQALILSGVDASRLTAKGYGDTVPLQPNDSEINRARNRRVQLVISP